MAGKPANFKVVLKDIKFKEVPVLDMEFVEEVSDAETVEAYKEEIKNELLTKAQEQADTKAENEAVEKVIEGSEIDIPELMKLSTAEDMLNDFRNRLRQQGLEFNQYLQFTNQTQEKIVEQLKEQGIKRIKTRLVLEEIVKQENITPSQDEVNEKLDEMAKNYKMERAEIEKLIGSEIEAIKLDIAVQKAIDFIIDNAKIK